MTAVAFAASCPGGVEDRGWQSTMVALQIIHTQSVLPIALARKRLTWDVNELILFFPFF